MTAMEMIPFNKPSATDREMGHIQQSLCGAKLSGDGPYTKWCQEFFERRFGFAKSLLTTSCTDALEMAAILLDIGPGDEVILPSFTFVSTANAFVLRGATLVFADSERSNPNISADEIETRITAHTKAIIVVHYAGVACDMDRITALAAARGIAVIEDAAQAIDACYKGRPLGSIGLMSAFSFHETKNVSSGEGGLLAINDPTLIERAEVIREKGTNRSAFFRGEADKYGWVDIGSSFLPSDILAAFLRGQLERLEEIQARRVKIWDHYHRLLAPVLPDLGVALPVLPNYATNNAHMFYIVAPSLEARSHALASLKQGGVHATFHYQALHKSAFYADRHKGGELPNCDRFTDRLMRLPLFYDLTSAEIERVCEALISALTP